MQTLKALLVCMQAGKLGEVFYIPQHGEERISNIWKVGGGRLGGSVVRAAQEISVETKNKQPILWMAAPGQGQMLSL